MNSMKPKSIFIVLSWVWSSSLVPHSSVCCTQLFATPLLLSCPLRPRATLSHAFIQPLPLGKIKLRSDRGSALSHWKLSFNVIMQRAQTSRLCIPISQHVELFTDIFVSEPLRQARDLRQEVRRSLSRPDDPNLASHHRTLSGLHHQRPRRSADDPRSKCSSSYAVRSASYRDWHLLVRQDTEVNTETATDMTHRLLLLVSQIAYICFLFGTIAEFVSVAANVGSHFIVNNLLVSAFILLWVHSHFWWAELILLANFLNLTSLYFRHLRTPFFVHIPVVSGPLAWNFVALFSNGAVMFHAQSLAARILANVVIWALMLYGLFFLAAFRDYAIGVEMAVLVAGKASFNLRSIRRYVTDDSPIRSPCRAAAYHQFSLPPNDIRVRHFGCARSCYATYRDPHFPRQGASLRQV